MAKGDQQKAAMRLTGLSSEELTEIGAITKRINALETKRSSLNADINAERKKIKALGIDLVAWAASKARLAMDPEQRGEFDKSRIACDQALGVPVQPDLFAEESGNEGSETLSRANQAQPTSLPGSLN